MAQALYRKYRSKKLSEIVGQEHITTALNRAIKSGRVSHAYLFTGPRGTGKTSIARILAHEINGLEYVDDSSKLDIIEIDAASNRRIDEIRDLRDKVHIAPTSSKYKVYIIDEVHMLTKEAFNALLKTLEEPPAHVIFILATTEVHKLPETIISRTQRYTFKAIEPEKVVEHLAGIAKREKISIDKEALVLIAGHGGGGLRDSISLLDQIANSGSKNITVADAERMVGIAPKQQLEALIEVLATGTTAALLGTLDTIKGTGVGAAQIAKQLSAVLRADLLEHHRLNLSPPEVTDLLGRLLNVPAAHDPDAKLEHVLLETHLRVQPAAGQAVQAPKAVDPAPTPAPAQVPDPVPPPKPPPHTEPTPPAEPLPPVNLAAKAEVTAAAEATESSAATTPGKATSAVTAKNETVSASAHTTSVDNLEWWPQFLAEIKASFNPLYGVLRMCEPRLTSDGLVLAFAYPFHHKKITAATNLQKVHDVIQRVTGAVVEFRCEVDKAVRNTINADSFAAVPALASAPAVVGPAEPKAAAADNDTSEDALSAVTEIFGGGEVLES